MRIFLDDVRDPREWLPMMGWFRDRDLAELDEWRWVKDAHTAIALLESENVVEISLDFDLGPRDEVGDGHMVVARIEERTALDEAYQPPAIHIHSSNISGREKLESAVASIERIMSRRSTG